MHTYINENRRYANKKTKEEKLRNQQCHGISCWEIVVLSKNTTKSIIIIRNEILLQHKNTSLAQRKNRVLSKRKKNDWKKIMRLKIEEKTLRTPSINFNVSSSPPAYK